MKRAAKSLWGMSKFRFAVVGLTNTFIDFLVLNSLVFAVGFSTIPANLLSTTTAMTVSFLLNQRFVFKKSHDNRHVVPFVVITLIGIYGIQTITIYVLTELWLWPLDTVSSLLTSLEISDTINKDVVFTNGAKVAAAASTLLWNYTLYTHYVFKSKE